MLNKTLFAVAVALLMEGCSTSGFQSNQQSADPLFQSVQQGAEGLVAQLSRYQSVAPVIVASAQNNDQLSQVCPQGRLISDIVSSQLTQSGFSVTEVRLTQVLHIDKEGETILSRELDTLASAAKVNTVVTATWSTIVSGPTFQNSSYIASSRKTYITLKAVRITDGLVLGSQTFASPRSWTC